MATLFKVGDTSVEDIHNPHIVQLKEEYATIAERYDPLQYELVNTRLEGSSDEEITPLLTLWAERGNAIQHEMLKFEIDALSFIESPTLTYTSSKPVNPLEQHFLSNHVVRLIRELRNDSRANRLVLVDNHSSLVAEARTQRSFRLANESLDLSRQAISKADESYSVSLKSVRIALWSLLLATIGVVISIILANPGCGVSTP